MQFIDDIPGKPAPPDLAITAWYDEMVRTGQIQVLGIRLNWTKEDTLSRVWDAK